MKTTSKARINKELHFLCSSVVLKRSRPKMATVVTKQEVWNAYMTLFDQDRSTTYADISRHLQTKQEEPREPEITESVVRKAVLDLRKWFKEFYADQANVRDQRRSFSEFEPDDVDAPLTVTFEKKGKLDFDVDELLSDDPESVREQVDQLRRHSVQMRKYLDSLDAQIATLSKTIG